MASGVLISLGILMLVAAGITPSLSTGSLPQGERLAVATTTILWDVARNVAGDLWRVEYVVEPGRDPHTFEPTPQDMVKAANAKLIFYNGFNVDQWITRLIAASPKANVVRVTEGLEELVLKVPDGPYAGREDPHMWMDTTIVIKYTERIRDAFVKNDSANADEYRKNASSYISQLEALDAWIKHEVSRLDRTRRLLFTQENAFQYFARAYDFGIVGYFYSIVTEVEPSAFDVVMGIEKVRKSGLCVFFIETTLSPKMMEMFARQVSGRVAAKLYTDSIGPIGSQTGSYLGMMKYNVEIMVRELSRWC
ncbi:MAG: zinc ABC transporter substrate-binding protein [Thaumarchaeota archaeon]|nr:zinc ABC transporter substrate-binding protein [Nitrososphaerota archaeon]